VKEYATLNLGEIDDSQGWPRFSNPKSRTSQTTPVFPQSHLQHMIDDGWVVTVAQIENDRCMRSQRKYLFILEREIT
jgi:hypothetical protein